jgi:hypothetical protein
MKPYTLAPSYRLGSPGCGCFCEPPGHPLYFVQSIYTKFGNNPPKGPNYFLDGKGAENLDEVSALYGSAKYPKLPLDHPRTRAWIKHLYGYMHDCYRPSWAPVEYGKPGTVIFPVQTWDDKSREAIRVHGEPKPEDHSAVQFIRKYYPEYQPEPDLINARSGYGIGSEGDWWETEAERPSPENCKPRNLGPHPINKTWCQWCGWVSSEEPVKGNV